MFVILLTMVHIGYTKAPKIHSFSPRTQGKSQYKNTQIKNNLMQKYITELIGNIS